MMFQVFHQSLIHVLVYFEVKLVNIYQFYILMVLKLLVVLVSVHIQLLKILSVKMLSLDVYSF